MINKIANTISSDFHRFFDFLATQYNFKLLFEGYTQRSGSNYVLIYNNEYVQIEFAGSENWFHAEIRKLVNGRPFDYDDEKNNIGFEAIAILESNGQYDHFIYYVPSTGLEKVLENIANLFNRNIEIFTTDKWIDTTAIQRIEDDEFYKRHGFKPSENKISFFESLMQNSSPLLHEKSFVQIFDSAKLAPYEDGHLFKRRIFSKGSSKISLGQEDWRDAYFIYYIEENGNVIFKLDTTKVKSVNGSIIIFTNKLKEILQKY